MLHPEGQLQYYLTEIFSSLNSFVLRHHFTDLSSWKPSLILSGVHGAGKDEVQHFPFFGFTFWEDHFNFGSGPKPFPWEARPPNRFVVGQYNL